MTQIDFYILQDTTDHARLHFACRLIDKATRSGQRVSVATDHAEHSATLDELLWSFRPESFVPHSLQDGAEAELAPVCIGHQVASLPQHPVLVNLQSQMPESFSRFDRLAEIVVQEPTVLRATRERYGFYKQRGYQINTHKL